MQGNLAGRSPADVLSEIQRRKASGLLRLQHGTAARQLFIDAGVMIRFAASTHPSDSMRTLFRDRGGVSDQQLQEASTAKTPEELLGTTLARLGFLTKQSLIELTQEHIRRVTHGALLQKEGTFEFQQGGLPFREQLDSGLSLAQLLLEWARDIADIGWLRQRLGSLESAIRLSSQPPEGYQSVPLNPAEGYTMSRVDGTATLREICIVSPMGEETTLRALFGLTMAGILEVPGAPLSGAQQASVPAASAPPAGSPPAASAAGRPVAPASGAPNRPSSAVRRLRPSGVRRPTGGVLPNRAPGNGGAPRPQRAMPARKVTNISERVRPATAPEVEQEMLARYEKLNESDLYSVLGVLQSSTNDDIRRAYYGLAKQFHPDKFTREEVKAKAEKAFAHITQAYSTLGNAEARTKYNEDLALRSSSESQKTVDAADIANMNFKAGKAHFDSGRYAESLSFFQNACEQAPKRAEYWRYLGLTQSKNPRWKKDAADSFQKAIDIDPTHADTYAQLGALFARGRLVSKARDMYQKALQWDPEQALAREGLAALDEAEGGKKGLLSIFKK
jgi:tetratricopeptide (TPR) repeat protein